MTHKRLNRLRTALTALTLLACILTASAAQAQNETVYLVDRLPAQALDTADGFDLSNPRSTLRSFMEAADAHQYETAAAALMLRSKADASPAALARMLSEIIDRQLWLDGGGLSDRPDAMIETVGDNPRAGETRRSIALGTIPRGNFPVTIRLNRYKAEDSDAVWLFSEDTVAAIPALYELHGPGWLEARLPQWWRERSAISVRNWEIAALPLLLLLAACVAYFINATLKWLRRYVGGGWPARGLDASATPLAILGAAVFSQSAINSALGFSGEITSILTPILLVGIVVALVMAVLRLIDAALDVVTRRYVGEIDDRLSRDDRQFYTSIYALRRIVTLIAFLIGAGLIFSELGLFRNVGISLLASAGVATVVLGIAGQTILGNILASLQIAIAKPIRIGD